MSAAYAAMLKDLFARQAVPQILRLERMQRLCAALDHPERALPAVLVAGTNGKGSTAAWLADSLSAAGRRCGLYTSPHLLRFAERLQIDGEPLAEAALLQAWEQVRRAAADAQIVPSFFEASTAMAFCAFAAAGVEELVLEVGLGGRLDATNVARRKLCLLTPIDVDHQQILGATLGLIAGEKAAILRPGVAAFSAPQRPTVAAVLRRQARQVGAPLHCLTAQAPVPAGLDEAAPAHLRRNAALAAHAALHLGVAPAGVQAHCGRRRWPGRHHWLPRRAGEPAVFLDGGHNPAGAAACVAALRADARLRAGPTRLIVAALRGKDLRRMLQHYRTLGGSLWACGLRTERRLEPPAYAALGLPYFADVAAAWQAACAELQGRGTVLFCGSLYLVGEALGLLTGAPQDPPVWG